MTKDEKREYDRARYLRNRETRRAACRAYHAANRDKINARKRAKCLTLSQRIERAELYRARYRRDREKIRQQKLARHWAMRVAA